MRVTDGSGLVGIAVSKKIGSKPNRNLVKRRWREALMPVRSDFQTWDSVWTIGIEATQWNLERIKSEVLLLIEQAKVEWAEKSECF